MSFKILILSALSLLMVGCSSLPANYHRQASYADDNGKDTRIGQALDDHLQQHPGASGFYPLGDGLDAFVSRLELIKHAEKTIDAQYYLFHDDLAGNMFMDSLVQAADRGVRVRLLVDDLNIVPFDLTLAVVNQHNNMEIRLFNPIAARRIGRGVQAVLGFERVNRRMHNKSLVVDNQVAIVGGRNIGNEYFKNSSVEFADLDMISIGSVVPDISKEFDRYWNSSLSYPVDSLVPELALNELSTHVVQQNWSQLKHSEEAKIYVDRLKNAPLISKIKQDKAMWYWGHASVYADAPEKVLLPESDHSTHLTPQLKGYIDKADHDLLLFTPYFVPGKKGVEYFAGLVNRGVKVTVVTNSLAATDVTAVHAGYSKYRKDLLKAGVSLIEVKPSALKTERSITGSKRASLHAKTFLIDQHYLFIGSLNLDPRSAFLNTEIGVVYNSPELAKDFYRAMKNMDSKHVWFLRLKDDKVHWIDCSGSSCKSVATTDPESSWGSRLGVSIMSLFPIEKQL